MTVNGEDELVVYAEPGDTDLTCDIVDVTVSSVLSFDGYEIMLKLAGGSGLLSVDGVPEQWESFTEIDLVGGFHEEPEYLPIAAMIVDVLEEWRKSGTKLRLLSAPGKMTTLVEDRDNWIPFPCTGVGT